MLSKEDVLQIARLAKLRLDDKEIEFYQKRLGRILDYVKELSEVSEGATTPVRHVPKDAVAFREDRPVPFEDCAQLLKNAPAVEGDSFLLPQVLE